MKRGRGKPVRVFSEDERKLVTDMSAYGLTHKQIAGVMHCDEKTLRKHCREELDNGAPRAIRAVAESLYNQALSGNVTASIFFLKARAGWSEKLQVEGKIDYRHTHEPVSETSAWVTEVLGNGQTEPAKKPLPH